MSTPTTATAPSGAVVRVERGSADAEELAAVTALLVARAATRTGPRSAADAPRGSRAGWRRLERQTGFRVPHSWQG